jgi:putative transposase
MTVSNELIDQLLAAYNKPEDPIGENGLFKQLTKRLAERALEAEMTEHPCVRQLIPDFATFAPTLSI